MSKTSLALVKLREKNQIKLEDIYHEQDDIMAESVLTIEFCFSVFPSLYENIYSFINENFQVSKNVSQMLIK